MKLKIGVKVAIKDNTTSKFLSFDRPVRSIELTNEESAKLGSSLLKNEKKVKRNREGR